MIRMFVRHPVADFPSWKQAYDDFDQERKGMGVAGHAVFQSAHDANDVTVWHDFETLESARAFAESKRLREVMGTAGVSGEPTIWYTSQA
ncbi:MAG: cyclase [Gemmatimonadales bacterium]|nr:cyclase [Gemmatimonadales bacterium]